MRFTEFILKNARENLNQLKWTHPLRQIPAYFKLYCPSAYVTLRFKLGDAFQFDWSEEWLVIGGKIKAASLVAFSQVEVVYMEPVIHASQP